MAAADLDDLPIGGIGHLAQKMHPIPIHARADLAFHLGAVAPAHIAGLAIGHIIAPDDQRARLGPFLQNLRQGAHEFVKAAHGFHVARHIGENLVLTRDHAAQTAERHLCLRVGAQDVGADTVMCDIDLVMKILRIGVALKPCRRLAQIDGLDIGEIHHIARMHHHGRMRGCGKFRVEPDRSAARQIEIFKKPDDRHIRPDLLERGQLAPSHMAKDHIGQKALGGQLLRGETGPDAGAHAFLPMLRRPIGGVAGFVVGGIVHDAHPRDRRHPLALGQKDDLMAALCDQPMQHLAILAGEILMHEKDVHDEISLF